MILSSLTKADDIYHNISYKCTLTRRTESEVLSIYIPLGTNKKEASLYV
jgi:hypothetical protein